MLTSESYKQLSDRCAQLAIASTAPSIAEALLALALDYAARATNAPRGKPRQDQLDGFGD